MELGMNACYLKKKAKAWSGRMWLSWVIKDGLCLSMDGRIMEFVRSVTFPVSVTGDQEFFAPGEEYSSGQNS
jgi:hypothetical protein